VLLIGGATVSAVGSALTLLAVVLHLRPLGPGWVAAAMAAELVPTIVLAATSGLIVDRVRNRELLVGALLVHAGAIALAAAVGLRPGSEWLLLAALVVLGTAATLAGPAVAALIPRIAGEERATRAYSWYSVATQAGVLGGFALAGLLVGATSVATALWLDAGSFLVMATAVAFVRTQRVPRPDEHEAGLSRWAGFVLLRRDRVLLVGVAGLAAAILASIVVNVAEVFFIIGDLGASPTTYGLVTAVWPAAGLFGGWAAGRLVGDRALLAGLALAGVAMGVGLIAVGAVVSLVTLVLGWALGGIANSLQRVTMSGLIRSRVDDAVRGRAFAATGGLFQLANVAGLGVGTVAVAVLGPRGSLLAAGVLTALVGAGTWLVARPALAGRVAADAAA
jgi:MFS family permease